MYKFITLTLLILICIELFFNKAQAVEIGGYNFLKGKEISILGGYLSDHGSRYRERYSDNTFHKYHEENLGVGFCIEHWCGLVYKNSFKKDTVAFGYSNGFESQMIMKRIKFHYDINIGLAYGYEDWQGHTFTRHDISPQIYPSIGVSYWITPRLAPKLSYSNLPKGVLGSEGQQILSIELLIHAFD